jgi:hypothetical protein
MRDIVFVAIALAFFGLSYLYVLGCDRIIGRETTPTGAAEPERAAATTGPTDDPTNAPVRS